ncbi:hypothetical protein [Croceicoccus sp. BE223]|nr:hypothetical protein [Croceicoccus sp. BE223]MDR7101537.1 hypothetical protein [Croceicoccus sp. BE223]
MSDDSVALVGAVALAGVAVLCLRRWLLWREARALMLRKMAEIRDGVRV